MNFIPEYLFAWSLISVLFTLDLSINHGGRGTGWFALIAGAFLLGALALVDI